MLGNATLTDGTATFPPVSLSAGTHQIVVSYSGDANFRPGSSGIRQVVIPQDFSVAAPGPTPASVSAGQSAISTVTVASEGGFSASVSLSCSVSPTPPLAPSCSLNPDSVQVGNDNSTTSKLTIATTSATVAASQPDRPSMRWIFALWLPVSAIMLAEWLAIWPRRRWQLLFSLGCILTFALGLQMGCGGGTQKQTGSVGTPSGNYIVTVQGLSGMKKHAVSLRLAVQ